MPTCVTVAGPGLDRYREERASTTPASCGVARPPGSRDESVLRPAAAPFAPDGGIRVLGGGLGRAVMKVSAVSAGRRVVTAPARVFDDQAGYLAAFDRGELERDHVAVVRFQGPRANGMPELHKLTPALGVLIDRGHEVALVTDGRMSGASGKVPAAIHCTPEAATGGPLARVRDGDLVRWTRTRHGGGRRRPRRAASPAASSAGRPRHGPRLFAAFRENVGAAATKARPSSPRHSPRQSRGGMSP